MKLVAGELAVLLPKQQSNDVHPGRGGGDGFGEELEDLPRDCKRRRLVKEGPCSGVSFVSFEGHAFVM